MFAIDIQLFNVVYDFMDEDDAFLSLQVFSMFVESV
uniref:Uncharacterized protein n=1 Tax=Anguilla anguilla TaxID=7936 RepID=A0A0E9P5Q0_ANGAN